MNLFPGCWNGCGSRTRRVPQGLVSGPQVRRALQSGRNSLAVLRLPQVPPDHAGKGVRRRGHSMTLWTWVCVLASGHAYCCANSQSWAEGTGGHPDDVPFHSEGCRYSDANIEAALAAGKQS